MYNCKPKCGWRGTQLSYDAEGQGHCPKCGAVFQGCVPPEKYAELTRRPPAPNSGGDSGESESGEE